MARKPCMRRLTDSSESFRDATGSVTNRRRVSMNGVIDCAPRMSALSGVEVMSAGSCRVGSIASMLLNDRVLGSSVNTRQQVGAGFESVRLRALALRVQHGGGVVRKASRRRGLRHCVSEASGRRFARKRVPTGVAWSRPSTIRFGGPAGLGPGEDVLHGLTAHVNGKFSRGDGLKLRSGYSPPSVSGRRLPPSHPD